MSNLPNVRKLFKPNPGYTLFEADLAGADAQVVAWEAGDEKLKKIFRENLPLHLLNAKSIFKNPRLQALGNDKVSDKICKEDPFLNLFRQKAKMGVHATNYGCQPPTLAIHLQDTLQAAQKFQENWFSEHPEILNWHLRTEDQLFSTRTITNPFGYKRYYFDRLEGLLPQALAWIPQSTVAITINKALVAVGKNLPRVEILLQVHDSFVGQFPTELSSEILPQIKSLCQITIPYPDPLIIPVSIKTSEKSWGDCSEIKI